MPGMSALRLLRTARENGSDASFIVMTGGATEDMLTEGLTACLIDCISNPINGLLNKPVNRAALIPLVQQGWSVIACDGKSRPAANAHRVWRWIGQSRTERARNGQ